MSASLLKADMLNVGVSVCEVPIAGIAPLKLQFGALFNSLGAGKLEPLLQEESQHFALLVGGVGWSLRQLQIQDHTQNQ